MERFLPFPLSESLLSGILLIVCLALIVWNVVLEMRLRRFLKGSSGKSLEGIIADLVGHKDATSKFRNELEGYLESVESRLKRSVQAVETLRFNPFKGDGSGGNLSFSTAIMNEDGDGLVLSSLYARDRVSMYAKPIHSHSPEFELTEEEVLVLERAKAVLAREQKK